MIMRRGGVGQDGHDIRMRGSAAPDFTLTTRRIESDYPSANVMVPATAGSPVGAGPAPAQK